MSQENVEIIRRAIEVFNEHGFSSEAYLGFYDAAVVFEEPPEQPAPEWLGGERRQLNCSASSTRRGRSSAPTRGDSGNRR